MTAFALEGLVQEALAEGVFTLLPKPFDIEHLVAALSSAARAPVVLVVDDAEPLATATAAALSSIGVRAVAATDGTQAIAAIEGGQVDVCVVDMVMPGMTGPEVIEAVRRRDPRVVFIAMSGFDVPDMFRKVAEHVHQFLRKPLDPRDLARQIARARARR
jgi:CheY-like chemotaxis protein